MRLKANIHLCWLFVAMSFPGAAAEQAKDVKRIEKESSQDQMAIVASVAQESLAGANVNLDIKVKNNSKEDVEFFAKGKYWDFDLKLSDSKGQSVPLTRFGKIVYGGSRREGSGLIETLAPGKEMKDTLNVSRVFDLTMEGEYTLTVSLKVAKGEKTIHLLIQKMKFVVLDERR